MTKSLLPVELLTDYMTERGLTGQDGKAQVAAAAESSVRSVERWLQYGVPRAKWALLQAKG